MSEQEYRACEEYHDLRGNGDIVVYKRRQHKSPRWNVRIRVPGQSGYVTKSCKTRDFEAAKRFSEDLYYELEGRSRRGESIRSHPFSKVAREWERQYPQLMNGRSQQYIDGNIRRVQLHLLPYFRKTPVDMIGEDQMTDYFLFRLSRSPAPTQVTVRQEGTVLRQVLKFAKRKSYITTIPDIPLPKMKVSARPDIPREEWRQLYSFLRTYVSQAKDKQRYRERFYLQKWVLVMANTGIRVGEMRNVCWADIGSVKTIDGESRTSIAVDGKTGARTVICNSGVNLYLERIWKHRENELGKAPPRTEPVFCNRMGEPIQSYKKGFARALAECGLLYQADGKKRVPYSLRHTYATMRITEGVSVYQLAANMGTSVAMIEKYYGKKRTSDPLNVTEITKMSSNSSQVGNHHQSSAPWA